MTELDDQTLATFAAQRETFGVNVGLAWGHFYQLTADEIMLYRPDYAKIFYDGLRAFRPDYAQRFSERIDTNEIPATETSNAVHLILTSFQQLYMYILEGWETGIYNVFRNTQSRGVSRAQLLEIVMLAQLQAGIRGLQLVYNAMGRYLPDFTDRDEPAPFPAGWAPDPDAFKAGLDLTVRDLTPRDMENVTSWYERTIGYVPDSVLFASRFHPSFYKWHRARWEIIFKTLPKQVAPYVMLRPNMIRGLPAALRETVQLAKAWGVTKDWIIHGLTTTAYYTGFEGLYTAHDAVDDLLKNWD